MRKFILSAAAAAALITASSSAFAGYWVNGPYGPNPYGPVYQPTYTCVPGYYGYPPVCGWN